MEFNFKDERPQRNLTLKGIIASSGLTQRQLAQIIGRSEVVVSLICNGRMTPTKFECYSIAAALCVHPRFAFAELYNWDDWSTYADQCRFDSEMPPTEMRRTT